MNRTYKYLLPLISVIVLSGVQLGGLTAFAQGPGQRIPLPPIPLKGDTTHTLSKHFTLASAAQKSPNAKGFIQRWMVLEPVKKDIVRNNIFTDNYLRTTFSADNFSSDYTTVPRNGETVNVGNQTLKWYALDSKAFNVNLYQFTYAINKPKYGILVWLVTIIDCPDELQNVRMAVGCNSGSMWWLNGQEALLLSGDRDMIADNGTSARLTLKKGRNIIRGGVINGPGMANFCVRFLDEKGTPVQNLRISYE
ncbi:acetylxylan esterase [Spirosoma sp. KCTC 42546]|uniref:acetylxylan esterase n=1 Tax=Spirosoma sp. KCTC 42546 TaxID=2520506 RepID=UPI001159E46C|nr:acetylxylan esterase [Spirosoma sp. KCTC 42546]QDK81883.1 acetylxylan esterase [Spirosoma sp. KCTC 42546]